MSGKGLLTNYIEKENDTMKDKKVAVYHRVMRHENFEKAAQDIIDLLQATQHSNPNAPRVLYVDIDDHKNSDGGFDQDMFELQKEFGMGFLLQFFTEIHFPLYDVENPDEQNNDIPEEFKIYNVQNRSYDMLRDLYIEDYSNTEFMTEEPVYEYLEHVADFLKKYNALDISYFKSEKEIYDPYKILDSWRIHVKNLINELFNSFVCGNLISVSAMTRGLIECYAYIWIFRNEESMV